MKILQIASGDFYSTYGGGQVYVKNIVNEMIRQKLDVSVISFKKGINGIIYKHYLTSQLIEIGNVKNLNDAILSLNPDIIHAHSHKDIVCKIGSENNIPVVVTAHHGGILCPAGTRLNCKDEICRLSVNHKDCLPCVLRNVRSGQYWYPIMKQLSLETYLSLGEKLRKYPFIPFITPIGSAANHIKNKCIKWNEIKKKSAIIIAPCNEIAEAMKCNGLDEQKLQILPHGIPLPEKRPIYPPIINGKIKFFYVGRICYVKGIHNLLESFSMVKNPAIELHLIGGFGNNQERKYMLKLQKKYNLDKRIVWHGKMAPESIFEATKDYHVSSSSAFLEAFGLNIAEALALGKPVLTTRCGGGEMQITEGTNGWIVPTNDVTAMAEKIMYICNNSEILSKMSHNCQALPIENHCNELLKIYSKCYSR